MNVADERAKLTATYLNGLAIAVFAVGGLAPIFTNLYASATSPAPFGIVWLTSVGCFVVSVTLHLIARRFLKEEIRP